jgi:hypothetical protein
MFDEIHKKNLLFVEGQDDELFFDALLEFENISDAQIINVKGRGNFKTKIHASLKLPGFSRVRIFAIICDAEEDVSKAFKQIITILRKEKLSYPKKNMSYSDGDPKIGIFIMPGGEKRGMLEDLCLKTVKDDPYMTCVNEFEKCINQISKEKNKDLSQKAKRKAQAFLATTPELCRYIGEAAKKGYWKFGSSELDMLREFLKNFS